jgi:soluble lytic murein transglycosylase
VAVGLTACLVTLIFLASVHVPVEERYRPIVEKYAGPLGIETELVLAVIGIESRGRPDVVSPKGAVGLMQLIPTTAEEMAVKADLDIPSESDLYDPDVNIRLGVLYLSHLLKRYNNDVILALGGYNAGPRRIKKWRKMNPDLSSSELCTRVFFRETRAYVASVLRRRKALIKMRGPTI